MSNQTTWIKEVAQETNSSVNKVKDAVKKSDLEITSKYDVLLAYAKWATNECDENKTLRKKITKLQQLVYDLQQEIENMKVKFDEQLKRKNKRIDKLAQTIEEVLKSLPLAS